MQQGETRKARQGAAAASERRTETTTRPRRDHDETRQAHTLDRQGDVSTTHDKVRVQDAKLDGPDAAHRRARVRKAVVRTHGVPHAGTALRRRRAKIPPRKNLKWMPKTCAYKLIDQGKKLPKWHPLISGDDDEIVKSGNSVKNRVTNEKNIKVKNLPDYIYDW